MVTIQARQGADSVTVWPLLSERLGTPSPDAALARRPAQGVGVRIDRAGFHVTGRNSAVSLRSVGSSSSRWARYSHGTARSTSFGRETVVVTPEKTEQFLTVERHQGTKTWRWRLTSPGLTPRLGADGAIAFLGGHKLAAMHVEPVAILDERGQAVTPKGLGWSLNGSVLELRLDDSKLPLPYVIDPAVSYRLAQVSNNGAGGAASITLSLPAGVVNNDLLFMHIAARGGNNMTIATPTGWTALRNTNSGGVTRLATFYRIASGEPASYVVTFGGTTPQEAVGAITAYYGVKSSGALDVNGATAAGNNATPTASTITAAANALVIAAYSHGTGNGLASSAMFTTAAGMAERYDAQSPNGTAGNRASLAADDILNAAGGATGAKAVTASASGRWVAHLVSFLTDDVNPTSTTTFPAAAGSYNAAGWTAGCAAAGICGTAADADSSVQKSEVSIRQGAGNYWNGASFASASEVWNLATGTTAWSYGFSAFPADGGYTVRVKTTDIAGNAVISSVTFTYDTTAPALATSLASSPIGPANNNSPAISGTAEAGSTVKLYTTGTCTGAPTASGTAAAFSSPGFTVAVGDDTSTTFKATATDAAGNVSGCSASSVTYVEDSTAPALPSSLASSPVSPANNNSPAITGAAEAGSTVKLYTTTDCSGSIAASGTAAAFSSPGLTVAVADNSSTTLKATATDAAGNVSGCSASSVTYVEDSTAPGLPASLASSPVSPANNNSPAISGTAEAGSTVKIYTTGTCTGAPTASGTAAAFSSPGITVAVSDDSSTTFKATATDAAGNVSGCSASSVTYVEDSTAPALPLSLASSPVSPANNNGPAISGTAEAGSTVKLYTTGTCTGAPTASGTAAAFSSPGITVAIADDSSTTFKATATDAAGNVSGCSTSSVTYVEDSTAPALPTSLASNPVGPANNNSPAISGTAEAGSTVKLYTTGTCTGAPTASGTAAAFSSPGFTVAVGDDTSTTFKATATDAAGNISGCSASSVTYVEDSTAPGLPNSLASSPVSPANNNSPAVSGTAEAGSTVKIYTTGTCTGAPTASGTAAAFSSPGITVAVSDDSSTTFKATATDAAGNVSGCSASSVTYVEDSTAPALPLSLASSPVSPANNNSPAISGTAEAGSTVKIYATGACTGAPTASGTAAAFSSPGITLAVSDDTTTTFKATSTDAAGNVSGCSASSVTYIEDSTAPALPLSLASSPISPANNNSPAIIGTAEAGSTVKIYTTGACTGAPTASGTAAAFSSPGITVAVADDSSTTSKATATDAAGNVSGCSASSVTYVEDSTAPALPLSLASSPISPANNNSPAISGTAEAGSTVKLYTTSDCSGSVAASGTAGAFSSPGITVAVSDDTSTTLKATTTDVAGNVSGCSASSVTYVEDSTAPVVPASLLSSPVGPANDNLPAISGTAEAGSTVKLYTTGTCTGAPTASGTAAAFSSPGITVAVADDSSTTFKATATDAAGNVSGCSASSVTYVEDSTEPAQPTSLNSTPIGPANDNSPKISGTAEAGSAVKLYTTSDCSGSVAVSGTAAAFSSPGFTVAVADDSTTTFKATATDAAGNVSNCSASSVTYVEDSSAPAAPSALGSTPASPANDNAPKITGTAEAGSTVKLYTTSDCSGAATATGTAAAFASPGLTVAVSDDSTTTFKATATDPVGNVSGCSTGFTYVEDSSAPAQPASLASTPASPANDNAPKITGAAEAGSTVKLYATSDCSGSIAASGTAAAFNSPGLTVAVSNDSSTIFKSTATDAAGNVSSCSTGLSYVEDSTAPVEPSGFGSTPVSPANDNSPKVFGIAEAGSTVELYTTNDCSGSVAASGGAAAFSSPGLAVAVSDDSTTSFKAIATDAAGNTSDCSSAYIYVEDSTSPSQPASLDSTPVSPANDNAPKITGSAEAGSTVKLYTSSDCSGSVAASGTAAAFNSPGLTVSVSDNSTTTFKATATDATGNVSGCSASFVTYVEDSNNPAAPSGLGSTPASPANDNAPKITGTAEAGSTVKLYTTSDCTGAIAASGTATAFAGPGLTVAVSDDSTTTFTATASNVAGNTSPCSAGLTYIEDSTVPAQPNGFGSTPASPANDNSPKITGTAEAGSTVKLYTTSDCTGAIAANGTAAAFSSPGLAVAVSDDSTTSFKAIATDAAGNASGCSSAYVYVEDSTLPTSTVAFPSAGANYSPSGWNAGCASAGFCGTASDASGSGVQTVEISIRRGAGNYYNGSSFSSGSELYLSASGTTSWSYGFATSEFPVDGSYTINVKAMDNAGNVESFSTRTFVYDSSAPSAPSLGFSALTNASATGQTIFFRSGAAGGFTVSASSSDPDSGISGYGFPALGAGWSGSQSGASYDYSFNAGATNPVEPNNVSAQNTAGLSSSTSFTVTPDGLAPVTSIACDGSPCAGGWYTTSSLSISLSANDGDSGVQEIRYTTDGSDPSPINGIVYAAPFTLSATTTVKFRSYDSVSNEEAVASQLVRIDDSAPSAPALTLSESPASPKQDVQGTTIYYNPQAGNSAGFTVDATTSDPQSGIDRVGFPTLTGMTGGGDDSSSPYQGSYSWTSASSASGSQTVTVHNNAGLTSTASFTVTPDTATPTGGSVSYPNGYASGSVTITTSDGSDALSGVDPATPVIERDATSLVAGACDPFTGSWSTVTSPDLTIASGNCYRYRYRVSDNVGNDAVYTSGNVVKVSSSAPAAPSITLAETPGSANQHVAGATLFYNPTGGNSGTFAVAADVTDSGGSGIDRVSFPSLGGMTGGGDDTTSPYQGSYDWNAGSTASGSQTVTVHNNAGLTSSASFTVTPDSAPPTGQSADLTAGYYTSLSVPVSLQAGSDALSGLDPTSALLERETATLASGSCVGWSGTWNAVILTSGADTSVQSNRCYHYRYSISDNVGNQSAPSAASAVAKVDATTPVTSDDAPAGWGSAPVTVALSVTETGSGVASTVHRVDGGSFQSGTSISIPAPADHSNDGVHTIEYRTTDVAGNVETLRSATVRIDTTLPTTTDDAPAGWGNSPVTVTLSPADALSGIASTQYRIDGGSFQAGTVISISAPADHSNDGVHTIEYRSADNAGNAKPLQTATVRIDTELPSGALTAPADGAHVNGSVTISASAADLLSGVASVEFLVRPTGSASFTTISTDTTAPYDASWDSSSAAEGDAELEVVVVDNAGLAVTSAIRTVVVDNPPTPTLDDPGANLAGLVTLNTTSPADTTQVVFERSPAGAGTWAQIATDTSAPFSADFDTSTVTDGHYDFRAIATDLGGFDGTSPLRTALVDNTAPTVAVSDPADGAVVGGASVHVAAIASDLGSGVSSVRFEQRPVGGGAFTAIGTDTTSPYEASWDTSGLGGGYELRAVATDAAANPATAATVTVTVDATAPSVTLDDPGALLHGVVSLSATAPSASVASVSFERRPAGGGWTRIDLDTTRPWGAALDTKSLADGVYDLRAQALGSGGQVFATHAREGVAIDNTAPTLLSATPADRSVVSAVTSIVLVASEPVAAVQGGTLDGSAATSQISGPNVTFPTSPLGAGAHVLIGRLVDAAGNSDAFSVRFTVQVRAHATLTLRVKKPKTKTLGHKRFFIVPVSLSVPARVQATLLSPTGRRLRVVKTKLSAGGHSLRFVLPTASLPPGRYTILVVATDSDGSKVVKRVYVTVARKHRTVKESAAPAAPSNEVVLPVAPVSGPGDGAATTSSDSPAPAASTSKPEPKKKQPPPRAKGGALETASGYAGGSDPGHTAVLVIGLILLGSAIAFLIKMEMGRMLAPRR
ncbi:MAG: Ig-like domain-containing protein [Actinomycetota bacterium]